MQTESSICALVPVRRRPVLLARALESVLAQTLAPKQVIVIVDDPSESADDDEATAARFSDPFARNGTRLRILRSGGGGPGHARNVGARHSQEEWLAFLDSDDSWSPEKLELQQEHLNRRPHLNACQTRERWFKHEQELHQPERLRPRLGRFIRDSFHTCLIACSSVMIRRGTFLELGGFDETYHVCEDFELWLRFLERYPIGLVPLPLTQKYSGDWPQQSRSEPMLDTLRIRAVLSAVERGNLTPAEMAAARSACLEKLAILERGAPKHGSADEISTLRCVVEARLRAAGADL